MNPLRQITNAYRQERRIYYTDGEPASWFWLGIAWLAFVCGMLGGLVVRLLS